MKALELVENGADLRKILHENALYFRRKMTSLGFTLLPGNHPIIPIMLGDEQLANTMATLMQEQGIFVTGFCYPVVPQGKARIRTQISAAHTKEDLDTAIEAFKTVGKKLSVIS
jgi:glycine C-acetyltransferase